MPDQQIQPLSFFLTGYYFFLVPTFRSKQLLPSIITSTYFLVEASATYCYQHLYSSVSDLKEPKVFKQFLLSVHSVTVK